MNLSFNPTNTLKKSSLISGGLYLWKSEDVCVFLGTTIPEKKPAFYVVGKLPLNHRDDGFLEVI